MAGTSSSKRVCKRVAGGNVTGHFLEANGTGKFKVSGDMSVALKLQRVI